MKKDTMERSFLKFSYHWSDEARDYSQEDINIKDGQCILEFINWFFNSYGLTSRKSCEQIECLLHKMPRYYKSRSDAAKWICRNWTTEAIYIGAAWRENTKLS